MRSPAVPRVSLAVSAAMLALGMAVLGACSSGVSAPSTGATDSAPVTSASTTPATTTTAGPAATASTTTKPVSQHVFPINPASVTDYGPGHHDYPATDIFCPVGSDFVAVTAGTVDFVSTVDTWDPATDDPVVRGGLSIAMVGDDGVRYYGSHLSAIAPGIAPGARVEAGQSLGATGNSGNARDTSPHLHFGVSHPTTAEDWEVRRGEVDTYPLLQAWERGENLTPVVPAA